MAEEKIAVVDTSVIVKWFSDEELTDKALELRQRYVNNEIEIVVPDLLLNELANALRYNPSFDQEDVKNAVQSLFDMDFEILAPSPEILKTATETSFEFEITVYDSMYLALAENLECIVITTDQELINKLDCAIHLKDI